MTKRDKFPLSEKILLILSPFIFLAFLFIEGKKLVHKFMNPAPTYAEACKEGVRDRCYIVRYSRSTDSIHEGYFSINRIYFDNGGYIEFEYCDLDKYTKSGRCYPVDERDGDYWKINALER